MRWEMVIDKKGCECDVPTYVWRVTIERSEKAVGPLCEWRRGHHIAFLALFFVSFSP